MRREHKILRISLLVGIGLMPILFRKPGIKKWSIIYVANAVASHILDSYFVRIGKLKYPIRLFPKKFRIHVVYDYFICPLISVLYCQTSYDSKFLSSVAQGFLFAVPQVTLEYLAEKRSKLIKYSKGWTWVHSYFGIVGVKLAFRGLTELMKPGKLLKIKEKLLLKTKYISLKHKHFTHHNLKEQEPITDYHVFVDTMQ